MTQEKLLSELQLTHAHTHFSQAQTHTPTHTLYPPTHLHTHTHSDLDAPNNTVFTFFGTVGALLPGTLPYMVRNGVDVFAVLLFLGGVIHLILALWFVIEYFIINWQNFRLPRFTYRLLSK